VSHHLNASTDLKAQICKLVETYEVIHHLYPLKFLLSLLLCVKFLRSSNDIGKFMAAGMDGCIRFTMERSSKLSSGSNVVPT